jgi:hypothetical protein
LNFRSPSKLPNGRVCPGQASCRGSIGNRMRSTLPDECAEFRFQGTRRLLSHARANSASSSGHNELFSRIRGLLQIRKVQRRSWKERGWRCFDVTGCSSTTPRTTKPWLWFGSTGKTATGVTEGEMAWMRGRTGGARFTGASASLKGVSGRSGRGIVDTQTAADSRKRTHIRRSRFTSRRFTTPSPKQVTS